MKKEKQELKQKITEKTSIFEAVQLKPEAAELLMDAGMHCVGCPMAMQETIEEGCLAHGLSQKEIDELIKKIDKVK